jgi:hypothetical protein
MKDERYDYIKPLIEGGKISRLEQWFPIIPKTKLAKDAGIGIDRFNTLINNIGLFSISEMQALAELLMVNYEVIHKMIFDQYREEQKAKKTGINKIKH